MSSDTPWVTLKDGFDGIEMFLLTGPKSMLEIWKHASNHGASENAVSLVGHLLAAGRLEAITPSGQRKRFYRLTAWNAEQLLKARESRSDG